MARVSFTPFIEQYIACPSLEVFGNTVREFLEGYFERHRRARGHLLDDRGCLRPRLSLSVDGVPIADRASLSDPVHAHARIQVSQVPLDTEYENL